MPQYVLHNSEYTGDNYSPVGSLLAVPRNTQVIKPRSPIGKR